MTLGHACETMDRAVRRTLHARAIPVGERVAYELLSNMMADNYTAHYYTGYKGTLAWEMNLQCASDTSAPDVCACIADNNDKKFLSDTGDDCKSSHAASGDVLAGSEVADDDPYQHAPPNPAAAAERAHTDDGGVAESSTDVDDPAHDNGDDIVAAVAAAGLGDDDVGVATGTAPSDTTEDAGDDDVGAEIATGTAPSDTIDDAGDDDAGADVATGTAAA